MHCSIIEDRAALHALAGPWGALAARARARPFQEFGWHAAWLSTVGAASDCRPHVAVLHQGERLLGVLPLVRRRRRGIRLLEWSGAGASDYCDALIDPGADSAAALAVMWDRVRARGGFDLARMGQVRRDAACSDLFSGMRRGVATGESAYVLPVRWRSGREWLAGRSASTRQHIGRRTRRLVDAGGSFWLWSPGEPLRPTLEALIAQKQGWLAAKGCRGLLSEPAGVAFTHAMADAMAASGALHLSALRVGGHPVACVLGLVRGGSLYYWMPTYDSGWVKHSPGLVLRSWLVAWCCEHGIDRFDLGIGSEDYKLQLGCEPEPLRTYVLPGSTLGRVATVAYRIAKGSSVGRPETSTRMAPSRTPALEPSDSAVGLP